MNKINSTVIATAISLACSAAAIAQGMSKNDYKAGKDAVATEYK
jgi:hypothetical protein